MASRVRARLGALVTNVWVRSVALVVVVALSAWSIRRVPAVSVLPAALGLGPWTVGKYVMCPLRWHSLSVAGKRRRWHLRTYAEGELLGLVSPGHAGADLWRVHSLHRAGLRRTAAMAEVGLDRVVGGMGLTLSVLVTGVTLPRDVLAAFLGVMAVGAVVAGVLRWRRPDLLAQRPLPPPRTLLYGIALSLGYQATILGLLLGTIAAVGSSVSPLHLVAVFGASQVAGIVPGLHGASPREGALVAGLVSLGVSWAAALGAVALAGVLAWVPALAIGGGSFLARRLGRPRTLSRRGPLPT